MDVTGEGVVHGWMILLRSLYIGGKVFDLLSGKHRIKMIYGKPFKIEETIGKAPESLSDLREASEGVFKRIEDAT